MGDHRVTVRIEFIAHGKTYTMDSSINWFDSGDGVDERVLEFFRESWRDAYARYTVAESERRGEERRADIEASERRELARLRAKYDSPDSPPVEGA